MVAVDRNEKPIRADLKTHISRREYKALNREFDYKLTLRQWKVIEVACNPGFGRSTTVVAQEAGIPHATLRRWIATNQDFRKAWSDIPARVAMEGAVAASAALNTLAANGNIEAIKLLYKAIGLVDKPSRDMTPVIQIQQVFNQFAGSMTPEQQAVFLSQISPETRALLGVNQTPDHVADPALIEASEC